MKAVGVFENLKIDSENSLIDTIIPRPTPKGREILVAVKAIGMNPVDTKARGFFTLQTDGKIPQILGWDASGIVESVGPDCTLFKKGDEVYHSGKIINQQGSLVPGLNSEYCIVDERMAGFKPKSLDFTDSASFPLATITAYEALFDRIKIDKTGKDANKTILIINGAGGVGSMAIQFAKKLAKLKVIATASRQETKDACKDLGADFVIDHSKPLKPQINSLGFEHTDYILCLSDTGYYFDEMTDIAAPEGHIATILETPKLVQIEKLMKKSLTFSYELMTTRATFDTKSFVKQHELLNEVANLIDAKIIKSVVKTRLHPICAKTLKEAHKMIESNATIGKIVLHGW